MAADTDLAERMRALSPAMAAAAQLLPAALDTHPAHVIMLAIMGQESDCRHRAQLLNGGGKGPARGLAQFELGGGVRGVLEHQSSRYWAVQVCKARSVRPVARDVWARMETDDVLAIAFARLLLFTDAKRLPEPADQAGAWAYYKRNWRPGKPHPDRWPRNHATALAVAGAALSA